MRAMRLLGSLQATLITALSLLIAINAQKCTTGSPVGLSDPTAVPISRIVTSSELKDHGKDQIRLNCCEGATGNAWCPDSSDESPYVEIHLEKPVAIGRIVIQPPTVTNQDTEFPDNFMKSFDLFFKLPDIKEFVRYSQGINAIVNKTISLNTVWLDQAIVTDVLRIEPRDSEKMPCFRMELYSCEVASLCPQDYCQNGGVCSGPSTCDCPAAYVGVTCQYSMLTIPKAVYSFLRIVGNTIITPIESLTFHGDVTFDISNSLILKPGSYIDLNSLTATSCFADLDSCFSGFTLNFDFSFSKLDTGSKVVLTNGAGINAGIKGVTFLFEKGQLHCYVVTSTKLWRVITSYTLEELSWYEMSISWSPSRGLLVLRGDSLIGSSYLAEILATPATITNNFMIGNNKATTTAELNCRSMRVFGLFWQDVKRAGLLTATVPAPTSPAAVTPQKSTACSSVSPVGISDSRVIPISSIVTSSNLKDHGKDQIRFNCCEGSTGNAWCPDSNDESPYVEIHLEKPVAIGQIVIQPPTVTNQDTEFPENFLKSFDLLFKVSGIKEFVTYSQNVNAIANRTITLNTIALQQSLVTDVIRIEPRESEKLACFRLELYSCDVASLCPQDYCLYGGSCFGPNTCGCLAGYFGERCQYSKLTIPKFVYSFLKIVGSTIQTTLDILTFHGDVTLDISNSLILKPGSYIDLNSLTANSCFADLDSCFSGFTLNFDFSFSKIDTGSKVVLTNGAGIEAGIKGITLLFDKGELHCYVVTSTHMWKIVKSFTLVELLWYKMSISWSPSHGLLLLHRNTLIGSSYMAEILTTTATITNNFIIGYRKATTTADLRCKSLTIIELFWDDVQKADLLPAIPTAAPTSPAEVTQHQMITACSSVSPVGISDPAIIPSSRIVTSSDSVGNGKDQIRLNSHEETAGSAWCPDSNDKTPYVEIHLEKPVMIGRIAIQPPTVKNKDVDFPENFMKSFELLFRLPGVDDLVTYGQDIRAIANKTITLNTIWLQQSLVTDVIRIEPRESEKLPCFRMELYACEAASLCPQDYCENSGTCSGLKICDCPASYFGERCQYSKITIPKVVYTFLKIVDKSITTSLDILTFHGDVTIDINKSLVIKPGSYIDLSSLTLNSCYANLDTCFSGFTLNFDFSFSKLDLGSKVVLTNGAGLEAGIKGITFLFDKGELHCYVVTSTQMWKVVRSFTLLELLRYEMRISWSPSQGLLVLHDNNVIGSSYMAEFLTTTATITNNFMIGYHQTTSTAELHWKSMTIIQLFWQDVKRADLLPVTTPAPPTTAASPTTPATVTAVQFPTCSSVSAVGISNPAIIPSSRIVTSSDSADNGKDQIRLNCCEETAGSAWCPDSNDKTPYVEIHLEKPVAISRIAIQPPTVKNQDGEFPENFMKSFELLFKIPGVDDLVTYAQNLRGIGNKTVTLNTIWLQQSLVTDVIRIEPRESEKLPCFRMELYACEAASLCPQDYCQNNGTCSGPNRCDCPASYFGERCQYSKITIPKADYSFLKIVGTSIITSLDILTFHGDVTIDINKSLVIRPGSYIDLNSLTLSSCYANLDTCFSGFTLNFDFSFSKLDLGSKIVLTNGAGLEAGIKGITFLFDKGELHCYVVTSTQMWKVVKSFTLVELLRYEMRISWSPSQGLLVLHDNNVIGSSYMAEFLTTTATITNNFMIGYHQTTSKAELHWKSMTIIQLFWQDVKQANLLPVTTPAPPTTAASPTTPATVPEVQIPTCSSLSPVGIAEGNAIPSSSIVVSSELKDHGKEQIRFDCCQGTAGNAWCPDTSDKSPYVEIHLKKLVAIGRIDIQAPTSINQSPDYPKNFMKSFDLLFRLPGFKEMVTAAENIGALVNETVALNSISFGQAIVTDVIRIEPRTSQNLPCFRMELYSCEASSLCSQDYCLNGGTCSGPNTCTCPASNFGEKCQYSKLQIPKAVYKFEHIVGNLILTSIDTLTLHGDVTLGINNSLIIKPGGYIDLGSLTAISCYANLDTCASGFTLNFDFSFSKLDLGSKIVLTNGAGLEAGIKGITLLFDKGELHCYVVTSTQMWKIVKSFTLLELLRYDISISWSHSQGLLVLHGNTLIGSSYSPVTLTNLATKTNMFTIGSSLKATTAELHWKSMTIIQLFWQDVKRADLLTEVTTTESPETTSPASIEDHFWNLININQIITVSNDWQLVLIGNLTVGKEGVELNGHDQEIKIPNLNNSCLTNPDLCKQGLTIQIKIKLIELEENTMIFTSGGQTDNPGVTLVYRYGFLHAIVRSTQQSWYVSVSRKTIWSDDFLDIIVTWSQHKTLKLIVNEVLVGESEGSVLHVNSLVPTYSSLTIGGWNTHCIVSQLHLWLVHIDILIERHLISCNLCTQKPPATTTAATTEDTTEEYGECPEGCISSEICYGEQTTPAETSPPPICVEPTTPQPSSPPTTEPTTIEICPHPECADTTISWSTKLPTTANPTLAPTTEVQTTPEARTEAPTTPRPTIEETTLEPAPTTQGPTAANPTTANPTLAPTTEDQTTPEARTEAPTTQAPTAGNPTTQAPTAANPTTQAPTAGNPTTQAPTAGNPTTQAPTAANPTTQAPTAGNPTTQAPTAGNPTTQAPTAGNPTTQAPTAANPTTQAPTAGNPTTQAPTAGNPTTQAPTAANPTTQAPTAGNPTTQAPTAGNPTTQAPTAGNPTTQAPTAGNPTTQAPTAGNPTTQAPTAGNQTTQAPTAGNPTTQAPTATNPTTQAPTAGNPTTQAPTAGNPTTQAPTAGNPTTQAPTAGNPTTQAPTAANPTTQAPTAGNPTTQPPTAGNPTTQAPTAGNPTTQAPTAGNLTTQAPTAGNPTTQAPTAGNPTTQAPTAGNPTTQAPTAGNPTTQPPTAGNPTQPPTAGNPTTQAPTAGNPTTQAPTAANPTTQAPTAGNPTTQAPTAGNPTTQAPTAGNPTTQAPTKPNPTAGQQTTEKCLPPDCSEATTPTIEPRTEGPTTPTVPTTAPTTAAPTTAAPTTAAPTTAAPTTAAPTTAAPTTAAPTTARPSCPPSTSSVTLTPEVNSLGQGQLTCSVVNPPPVGTSIRFTWRIQGSSETWVKEIESPDRSASISSNEIKTSILKKRITCTAEIKYLTAGSEWCWPVESSALVPSITCPPVNRVITVVEGSIEQQLQVRIPVPPSLLCKAEDNGQCRVEVTTTLVVASSELKCSSSEIIPQAVLGVTTIGSSCGVAITSENWQNAVTIPIKATVDGIKDGERRRKLTISVRIVGQVSLDTTVESCADIDVIVVDRDEGATCSSVNDPHMKTFDNVRYNNFIPGEFIMFKHTSLEIEVRAFYRLCNTRQPKGPTCNCGAAVKSGDDVITFDTCSTKQNQITTIGNSVITVAMFKNGQLTPGTRILRLGCGQKYEVHLPTGTIVTITSTKKPFMNINIQASSSDFEKTEGLCGLFNKKGNDDLDGHSLRNPDLFSVKWKRETTIFKGVPAIAERPQTTYCSCLSGRQAVCRQGLDTYTCGGGTVAANDITEALIRQAKTPLIISQTKGQIVQVQNRLRRDVDMSSKAATGDQDHYTEEGSRKYCTEFLQNSLAVIGCVDHLREDAVNESIANCAEDLMALNDTEWATSHVEDLIEECLVDARTNASAWENITSDGPILPDFVNSSLCVVDCGHGSCVQGICQCPEGWSGETCQIGPDSIPSLLPALEACDTLTSSCADVSVDGYSFLSPNLTCKMQYLTVGDSVTETAATDIVPASFISLSQAVCPQKIGLTNKGRSAIIFLSNDGIRFGNSSFIHIVHKSTCQTCTLAENLAGVSCKRMIDTCNIDNECYSRAETFANDNCFWCNPDVSVSEWTKKKDPNCTYSAEPIEGSESSESNDKTAIIVLGVLCGVLALVIVGGAIAYCKIRMSRKSQRHGLVNREREGSYDFYHSQSPITSADLTGQSQAAKENAFTNPALSS